MDQLLVESKPPQCNETMSHHTVIEMQMSVFQFPYESEIHISRDFIIFRQRQISYRADKERSPGIVMSDVFYQELSWIRLQPG